MAKNKFDMGGSRTGFATFEEDGRCGSIEWELLVGPRSIVVYAGCCFWTKPVEQRMTKVELLRLVSELAHEHGFDVKIEPPVRPEGW